MDAARRLVLALFLLYGAGVCARAASRSAEAVSAGRAAGRALPAEQLGALSEDLLRIVGAELDLRDAELAAPFLDQADRLYGIDAVAASSGRERDERVRRSYYAARRELEGERAEALGEAKALAGGALRRLIETENIRFLPTALARLDAVAGRVRAGAAFGAYLSAGRTESALAEISGYRANLLAYALGRFGEEEVAKLTGSPRDQAVVVDGPGRAPSVTLRPAR